MMDRLGGSKAHGERGGRGETKKMLGPTSKKSSEE